MRSPGIRGRGRGSRRRSLTGGDPSRQPAPDPVRRNSRADRPGQYWPGRHIARGDRRGPALSGVRARSLQPPHGGLAGAIGPGSRNRHRRPLDGDPGPQSGQGPDPPPGPGIAVHVPGVRQGAESLRPGAGHGRGRSGTGQRPHRELLRHARSPNRPAVRSAPPGMRPGPQSSDSSSCSTAAAAAIRHWVIWVLTNTSAGTMRAGRT